MKKLCLMIFFAVGVAQAATITVHNNSTNTFSANTLRFRRVANTVNQMSLPSSGTLAPGGTASVDMGSLNDGQEMYGYNTLNGNNRIWKADGTTNTYTIASPSTGLVYEWWVLAPSVETNCLYQFAILNNTAAIQTYYAARSQVIHPDKTLVLNPGASGILQFNALCADDGLWTVLWAPFGEPFELDVDAQVTPVGSSPTNRAPTIAEDPSPVAYNPTNNVGTNAPIQWEVSTNDTQTGYNALFEAITKGNAKQDLNMQTLISNVVNVSNYTTNGNGDVVAAINSFHSDATNASGAQAYQGTVSNHVNGLTGVVETANEGILEMDGGLSEAPIEMEIATVTPSFWEVEIVQGNPATKVDFNVLSWLAPVANVMKTVLQWALLVSVSFIVIKDIAEAVSSLHRTTQLTLPNLQGTFLGVGGNWGAALLPFYVAAWLGIWGILILTISGLAGNIISAEALSFLRAGPFGAASGHSSAVAQGLAIAASFVPWAAIVSMTTALLVWKASLRVAVNLARVFAKLMIGA